MIKVYNSKEEAVETAIEIHKAWKKDCPDDDIQIGHGCNGGMTMEFEDETYDELRKWATDQYNRLPKCDHCGKLIDPDEYYTDEFQEDKYCSLICADWAMINKNKSEACHRVLQLMDENYLYAEALAKALEENEGLSKEDLEEELNLYI